MGGTADIALADVTLQKPARRSRFSLRAGCAVGRLGAHERFLAVRAARRRRHARRPHLARSGHRRHRRPARCRRHPAFRPAQQLPAPRRSDAVPRAVAGVALARIVVRAGAARRPARRRHRAHAQRRRARRVHGCRRFHWARHRKVPGVARRDGAHGPAPHRFAHGAPRARERRHGARLAGLVPRRARGRRAARHRRVARRPRRSAGRQRRSHRGHGGRDAALEPRAHAADGRQLAGARSAHRHLGVRHRGSAAIPSCAQDAADRRRVARLGAARRSCDERRADVRRSRAVIPIRRWGGRVSREGQCRGRPARLHPRLADGGGSRRHHRVRQHALRGTRQRPPARQSLGRICASASAICVPAISR